MNNYSSNDLHIAEHGAYNVLTCPLFTSEKKSLMLNVLQAEV